MRAPFSSVIEYAAEFFTEHPNLGVTALPAMTARVRTNAEVKEDHTDPVRRHDALRISWVPRWPLFPNFEGLLTVRPSDSNATLGLEGSYDPPGGSFGKVFDRVIGQQLAMRTMANLMHRLARHIEVRYKNFQASLPTIEELNESARGRK